MDVSDAPSETLVALKDLSLEEKSQLLSNRNVEEIQIVADRVQILEEHMRHLYDNMVEFIHGKALLRDVGDGLAKVFNQFGQLDQLPVPTSTNYTMILLGDAALNIGDKMDSEISHFETKIFPIFASFGSAFKSMKNQLAEARQTEDQHVVKRNEYIRFLDRTRNTDDDKYVEKEEHLKQKLIHCMNQSSACRRKSVKKLAKLEKKKCEDLKKLLSKWFLAQASVAGKTLELSVEASRTAMSIDTSGDINKLLKHLNLVDSIVAKTEMDSDDGGEDEVDSDQSHQPKDDKGLSDLLTFSKHKKDDGACGDSAKKSNTKHRPHHRR